MGSKRVRCGAPAIARAVESKREEGRRRGTKKREKPDGLVKGEKQEPLPERPCRKRRHSTD